MTFAHWKKAAAATLAITVAGCGSAGKIGDLIGGSSSNNTPPPAVVAPTVANANGGFFVSIPDATNVTIGTKSPDAGQQVTLADLGVGASPEETDQNGQPLQVPRRSLTISGTGVSAPASGALAEWIQCQGDGCPAPDSRGNREFWAQVGVPQKKVGNTWVDLTDGDKETLPAGTLVRFRERNLQVRTATGTSANLQSAHYGFYSDLTLEGLIRSANNEEGIDTPTAGVVHAAGAYYGGTSTSATELSALKTAGTTATYAGWFSGSGLSVGETLFSNSDSSGPMTMSANFGAGTVNGHTTGLVNNDDAAPAPRTFGVGFNGTITGSTYTGAAYFTNGTNGTSAGGTGNVAGGFYGANAAETAGALRVQGTAPGTTGTTALIGSFGARKN